MKIFLTGGSGLVGIEIKKIMDVIAPSHLELDMGDRSAVFSAIKTSKPDCVIHCAALTNVDRCEVEKENAWMNNVLGTKNIADACKETGAHLIFFSTDYVFDGAKGLYMESDVKNPLNFYGQTKLIGEWLVSQLEKHTILRPSVIYGAGRQNFVTWVIDSLKNGRAISVVTDQYNSPTLNIDIAHAVKTLAEKGMYGVYHCAGDERINRYDLAIKIADAFQLDPSLIRSACTADLKQCARRPKDSSLSMEKIKGAGIKMSNIETGLKKMKTDYFK